MSARHLLHGPGLGVVLPSGAFDPLVSQPPLYPLSLALGSLVTGDLLVAARWIDAVAIGALVTCSGLLLLRIVRRRWTAVYIALLLCVSPSLLIAFTSAMPDPIALLASVSGSLTLLLYLEDHRTRTYLISAVCVAFGLLARYAGAAFVASGVLTLLYLDRSPRRARLVRAGGYAFAATLPTLGFLVWSRYGAGSGSPRAFASAIDYLPKTLQFIGRLADVVWGWKPIGPGVVGIASTLIGRYGVSAVLGSAIFSLAVFWVVWRMLSEWSVEDAGAGPTLRPAIWIKSLGLSLLAFVILFYGIFMLSYPTPDVDSRTMLPILPLGVFILLVLLGHSVPRQFLRGWAKVLSAVILTGVAGGYFFLALDLVTGLHRTGLGYTGRVWRESETLQAVASLPRGMAWVSNEPMPILLYYDRWPYDLIDLMRHPSRENPAYLEESQGQTAVVTRDKTVAWIVFDTVLGQMSQTFGQDADRQLRDLTSGLVVLVKSQDGTIYISRKAPE